MLVTFCHTLRPQSSQQQYSRCQSDTSANQLPVVVCRICFACLQTVVSLSLLSARSTSARLALSYSEISPNETCLPCMLRFNPAPQTPGFLRSILHLLYNICTHHSETSHLETDFGGYFHYTNRRESGIVCWFRVTEERLLPY